MPDLAVPLPEWAELTPDANATIASTHVDASVSYVRDVYGFVGTGQTVAVIDSGIAYDHVALGGGFGSGYQVVGGWDFTEENDADPHDDGPAGFHGTHVAGIIASGDAQTPGVAPGVDLVALRVFNDMGLGYVSWVEQALAWVHDHRIDFRYPITTVNLSLGSDWNGSTPPGWATLEDELAVLAGDGIFIAVAAGNSFVDYGAAGLAYPAASPHVVPVASVDANGQLSEFSQRQRRALAAPGERINSTVPDHIFGTDGDPNDWSTASGTSMAAPYVAAASVLVREALQFAGVTSIDQADIYRLLRDTADLVFDPITSDAYYRVNLARTIDSIMPADDYGSTVTSAHNLGTLSGTQAVSGQLTRLDDCDFFQFTPGSSGELSLSVSSDTPIDVALSSPDVRWTAAAGQNRFRVDEGQTYTLVVSALDHVGNYDLQLIVTPQGPFRVDGDLVQVVGTAGNDAIRFAIDKDFRVEVNGQAFWLPGTESWRFELAGGGGQDTLTLTGSHGSDEVVLRAGSAVMTGPGYRLHAVGFPQITAVASAGVDDVARFYDTPGNDEFIAGPNESFLRGRDYVNRAVGFDRVYAYASQGADDVARFYDSPGDDEFIACPDNSVMRGDRFYNKAVGFDRTYACATGSHDDVAQLFDSAGNDEFVADPTVAVMSGSGYYNKAINFNRTYATASTGPDDVARLHDSAGNDLLVANASEVYLRGTAFFNKAIQFDRVYAYASTGSEDIARFYDSAGNDQFAACPSSSVLSGAGYFHKAINFDRVYAYAVYGGADNVAHLTGGAQDNRFYSWSDRQVLRGDGFYADVRGFDRIYADLVGWPGGIAYLYDSPATERYLVRPDRVVWETADSQVVLEGFGRVHANSSHGGNDVALLQLGTPTAQFIGQGNVALALQADLQHELRGFSRVVLDLEQNALTSVYVSAVDYVFQQIGGSLIAIPVESVQRPPCTGLQGRAQREST